MMNDTYMGHDKTDTQLEADLPLELPEKEPRRGNPEGVMSLPLQSRSISKLPQEYTVTFSIRPKESD